MLSGGCPLAPRVVSRARCGWLPLRARPWDLLSPCPARGLLRVPLRNAASGPSGWRKPLWQAVMGSGSRECSLGLHSSKVAALGFGSGLAAALSPRPSLSYASSRSNAE